ncbi:MAG: acetyl-CoA acetyltransferase [Labilithrix sp.]|nr:acetyl-CoA acetyltransferase [Labilithrix sp.]
MSALYVLGGFQTDYARHFTREKKTIADLMKETIQGGLEATGLEPSEIGTAHVANFVGELFCHQANLGGLVVEADHRFDGIPTSRHEGACAAGSLAVLAASADIESGRYDTAMVVGAEILRAFSAFEAQHKLGVAAWVPRETEGVKYPWPDLFAKIGDAYAERWGLDRAHTTWLARNAFANAKRSPNAQTRGWTFEERSFAEDDEVNPSLAGRIRRQDCSQVTDGGTCVFLASEKFAREYAKRRGIGLEALARLEGWGHRTTRMALADKLAASKGQEYLFPHVRGTITDALGRAGTNIEGIDVIETHDCFTTTAYMAIDHFGLTPPGESWRAIEDGVLAFDGKKPLNPTGGLIGTGHPVGATGVRMVLDGWKQVTGRAGDAQVPNARRVATLNLGGSATTSVSFVVGRGQG